MKDGKRGELVMQKKMRNNQGRALTELLLVMVILLFFVTATFVMVVAGQQASQKLIHRQEGLSELRTAYAYLNTRLRQHDEADAVSLRPHPFIGTTALVIEEEYYGISLETWVYFSQGYLREVLVNPSDSIDDDISFPIAKLHGFELTAINQGRTLTYEVSYKVGEETLRRSGRYQLKTRQQQSAEID